MKADKVLVNGKILSIDANSIRQKGTAIAIAGEKIIAVGDDGKINALIDADTEVIDCKGNTILPGLCDAHCHPSWAASFYLSCDLFNVFYDEGESAEDIIKKYTGRVKKYIEEHPSYTIIRGIGWNLAHFSGSTGEVRMPTRHDLDKICSDKPVILESYCQHNIWCNTKAIETAGLTADTPSPSSGIVFRENDGYPEGIFQEMSAINLIRRGIPGYDFTVEEYKNTIRRYQKELANSLGVTMLHDCTCTENAKQAYYELARDDELTLRIRGVHTIDAQTKEEDYAKLIADQQKYNAGDLFQINTVKFFIEGAFAMLEPYEPEVLKALGLPDDYTGDTLWNLDDATEYMAKVMNEGYQVHCHAMGDAAIKLSVDAIQEARKLAKQSTNRDTIAHVMAIPKGYFKKMGEMKLICAAQPRWSIWDTDVEDFYIPYLGRKRALDLYPIGRFTDAGCIVSYGTDFPVTPPPDPFHELQCAMTRSVFGDAPDYDRFKGRILGHEDDPEIDCVSMEEAIKSLSLNGAYQMFMDHYTGSIEVGKSADLVILKSNMENTPIDQLYDLQVESTLFKGKVVYKG